MDECNAIGSVVSDLGGEGIKRIDEAEYEAFPEKRNTERRNEEEKKELQMLDTKGLAGEKSWGKWVGGWERGGKKKKKKVHAGLLRMMYW
ncbi:hypothetical protein IF2G_06915 [Cordyceps javanica]|nr:hypothetical protein IF2G_06915 [Cordyceps javanica]